MPKPDFKKHIYRYKRYYTYMIITAVALILPWFTINGNHFFLLDFSRMVVNLFFVKFNMQELYLMPFLLILGFLGVFFMTTLGGRVWCGWTFIPPQTFFQYIQEPAQHPVLVGFVLTIAGFLIYDITRMKENFCIYVCPYARVQSVMYDEETIQAVYDTDRGGI